jgi:pimeloyl-ACP methyl ester carboxylesterase
MIEINDLNQTLKLNDGRTLGYAERGASNGKPVFHFNGFPGSRLEITLIDEKILIDMNVRLIGVDRPGMGLSDFKKGRTLLDWSDDIIELANHLGLDKFAVEGVSGGSPYSIACAFKIPERITSCAVIGGIGPTNFQDVIGNRILYFIIKHFYFLIRISMYFQGRTARNLSKMESKWKKSFNKLPKADKSILTNPEKLSLFLKEGAEAFKNGSKGVAYEGRLYANPWHFKLEEISPDLKVFVFHGELDSIVPINVAREVSKTIPNCSSKFYPNDGHYSVPINHIQEILINLI